MLLIIGGRPIERKKSVSHPSVNPKEVMTMSEPSQKSRQCCSLEKTRLVEELSVCDNSSSSYEEFHQCYRDAARESGQRSRSCMVA